MPMADADALTQTAPESGSLSPFSFCPVTLGSAGGTLQHDG